MRISRYSHITLLISIVLQFYGSTLAGLAFPHPVGFWMFDKQNEGKDFSGNGNDAVLYNTEWTSGPYGTPNRVVKFTGADDQSSRIVIPNSNGDLSVTDSFTWLTMFIDLDTNSDEPLFSMGPQGEWGHKFFKCCNGNNAFHPRFDHRGGGGGGGGGSAWSIATSNFFSQDEWIKVAVTYDQPNSVIKIYQHDEERIDLRASYSGLLDDEQDEVNIGAVVGDSRELHAGILCTMYFDEALTQEQLSAAFSLCKPNEYKSLYPWPATVAHWPLNSYFGINNAADGLNKDGVAQYYSVEKGPYGEAGGSYFFRQSFDSWGTIDNNADELNVNSFTFTAWFKPGIGNGPLFRVWGDASGSTAAPHIWKHSDESQLHYAHYTDGSDTARGSVSSDTGVLKIRQWNYVAVVYNYGEDMNARDDANLPGPIFACKSVSDRIRLYTRTELANGRLTTPERKGIQYFDDFRLQRGEWAYVAAVYDFEWKSWTVYLNDKVQSVRANRHIQKTFLHVMVNGWLDLDQSNNMTAGGYWTRHDMSMSCLQFYDIALSQTQIQSLKDICQKFELTAGYSRSTKDYSSGDGLSLTNPEQTVSANSRVQCALMCHRDNSCNSFAYDNSQCGMDSRIADDLNTTFYSNTGRYSTEKDSTPWKLFV